MSQDAKNESTQVSSSSNTLTDLSKETAGARRYKIAEKHGLRVRLKSWNGWEFEQISKFPTEQQTLIGITYSVCDDNGDCTIPHTIEGAKFLRDMDAAVYTWLAEEVLGHCLQNTGKD